MQDPHGGPCGHVPAGPTLSLLSPQLLLHLPLPPAAGSGPHGSAGPPARSGTAPRAPRSHGSRASSPLSRTTAPVWSLCLKGQDSGPRGGHSTEEPGAPSKGQRGPQCGRARASAGRVGLAPARLCRPWVPPCPVRRGPRPTLSAHGVFSHATRWTQSSFHRGPHRAAGRGEHAFPEAGGAQGEVATGAPAGGCRPRGSGARAGRTQHSLGRGPHCHHEDVCRRPRVCVQNAPGAEKNTDPAPRGPPRPG